MMISLDHFVSNASTSTGHRNNNGRTFAHALASATKPPRLDSDTPLSFTEAGLFRATRASSPAMQSGTPNRARPQGAAESVSWSPASHDVRPAQRLESHSELRL